jgi:hypothetical protein
MSILTIHDKRLKGNFKKGRDLPDGLQADVIVIHVMEGTMAGTLEHFNRNKPKDPVSAHYGVSKKGEVVLYVSEEDTAYANGLTVRPTADVVTDRDGINPNNYTISIEFEGMGDTDLTDEQREVGIRLIRDIAKRRSFPINRYHVVGHNEIRADKQCPGDINVDLLVKQAASDAHPKSPFMIPPRVVWSDFFGEYLIVMKEVSDKEWYFIRMSQIADEVLTKAVTPLSRMPVAGR